MLETIQIVDFNSSYQGAYKSLNVQWIEKYFGMEEADFRTLDHPRENLLDKGGYIAVALWKNEVVETCALMKMENDQFDYELTKMAVAPKTQGLGIGHQLGLKVIDKAKALDAKTIFFWKVIRFCSQQSDYIANLVLRKSNLSKPLTKDVISRWSLLSE